MANNNNNIHSEEQKQYFKDRAGTDEARFHVVPHDEEGWADSQSDAVEEAKRMAGFFFF